MSQPEEYMRIAGYHRADNQLPGKILDTVTFRGSVVVICEENGSASAPYILWDDGTWRKVLPVETS